MLAFSKLSVSFKTIRKSLSRQHHNFSNIIAGIRFSCGKLVVTTMILILTIILQIYYVYLVWVQALNISTIHKTITWFIKVLYLDEFSLVERSWLGFAAVDADKKRNRFLTTEEIWFFEMEIWFSLRKKFQLHREDHMKQSHQWDQPAEEADHDACLCSASWTWFLRMIKVLLECLQEELLIFGVGVACVVYVVVWGVDPRRGKLHSVLKYVKYKIWKEN